MQTHHGSPRQYEYFGGPLKGAPLLAITAAAVAMVIPFYFLGVPSGHDFEFHVNSWIEVLNQWRQGIIYPRWAGLAHYGYGEARFIFYPPTSWALGAALGAVLPWTLVPGAYVWLALTFSGCSMFLLARRWLNLPDSIFAAALYAANPYCLVIVYWRSACAELLAGALFPLLLLCLLKMEKESRKAIVLLSLVVAGTALTNVPASVIVDYSVALLAIIFAVRERSPKILLYAAAAGLLGAALAAFYLFPAYYEGRWVNISQVLSAGVRPQDNFMFTATADPDHNRFNRLVSLVAAAEVVVLGMAAFSSRKQKRNRSDIWWPLVTWGGTSAVLMCSISAIFWRRLPLLEFLQFPWRWLLCLNVALVVLLTLAWKRWIWRVSALLVMLAALAFGWHRIQAPWWDHARDIAGMVYQQQSGAGYEGTDEYVPARADPYDIKLDAPRVSADIGTVLRVDVRQWSPEKKLFVAEVNHPCKLVLRLFNYPAWLVDVNGQKVETETQDDTGQMLIPVKAGENLVQVSFSRTWDRTLGGVISLVTAAGLLLWVPFGLSFRGAKRRGSCSSGQSRTTDPSPLGFGARPSVSAKPLGLTTKNIQSGG